MERKRGIWGLVFVLVLLSLVSARQVLAQGIIGAQTELLKYEISVKKFEVSYGNGSTWVTVFEGVSQKVDIALGASAGTFFSGQSLPVGTVNRIRVTIDKQMTIKGTVYYNPRTFYTVANIDNDEATDPNDYAEYTFSADADIIKTIKIDVVVGVGETVTLRITFEVRNVDNAITLYPVGGGKYIVIGREVTVTVQVL